MSSQLSKEQIFALFEEIKQEQATQFPLSEKFLKQYFSSLLLNKAKNYVNNGQVSFLEHDKKFSNIDSQVIDNSGATYSQNISISVVNGLPSLDAQCTCSSNRKCAHIAAVLLKLKIDHSGGFGEAYFVNDWFNELLELQHSHTVECENVFLFVLEHYNNKLVLTPKISSHKPDGNYPIGRLLTDQQLNSYVAPSGVCESDFRLFTWVRSQNVPGHFEIMGNWGFSVIQQLIKTNRFFFQSSRQPISFGHQQNLHFDWQKSNDLFSLNGELENSENWFLLKTDPPLYYDANKNLIGRINSELDALEIAHLLTMPDFPCDQIKHVMSRFNDAFTGNIILPPAGVEPDQLQTQVQIRLSVKTISQKKRFNLKFVKVNTLSKAEQAKLLKRSEQILFGVGFELNGHYYSLPIEDIKAYHWFNNEIRPFLQSKGWQVDEISYSSKVTMPKVCLSLNRDKQHNIIGKIKLDDKVVVLDWDKGSSLDINRLARSSHYIDIADNAYALPKLVYEELIGLKSRFSYYVSSSQFKFPLSYAKQLLALEHTPVNSIDLKLLNYVKELDRPEFSNEIIPASTEQNFQLRDYQEQGVNWLKFLNRYELGGILADDMGLGKTLQVIAYFLGQHNILITKPSLIICPTSLVSNWQNEFKRFAPNLELTTIHGSHREKELSKIETAQFILTTYPLLKRDLAHYKPLEFDSIVLDEAQYIKNEAAQVSKCVKQLHAQFKLCLSGTPIENNLLELKSLLDFVMPDVLGSRQKFKQYFQIPIEKDHDQSRSIELKSLIAPFILRRTKSEVVKELPDKTEIIKELEFSKQQHNLYLGIQKQLENKLVSLFAEQGAEKSKLAFLDVLLKLRQICCHPKIVDTTCNNRGAKLVWLEQHLPIMLEQGHRVIIFSQFTTVLEFISELLVSLRIEFSKLTGQTRHREKVINEFTQGQTNVFLISLKAGGTGLNLTQADTVIHFDPWWNPAVENQATDRAYRIGQDKPVFVYKLIMSNSIETKVFQMQQQKQALVDALFEEKTLKLGTFDEKQMLDMIR